MEELIEFENTVEDEDGRSYVARVLGREREDGTWIGVIRFTPLRGGEVLETDRETTQPNRADLRYWSTGLTYFYLEGALARARRRAQRAAPPAGDAGSTAAPASPTAPTPPAAAAGPTAQATPAAPDASTAAGADTAPVAVSSAPRLEVLAMGGGVVETLIGARSPRPGTSRDIPGAGTLIYEGVREAADGEWHRFSVGYGSRNAGATLANWLWSRLHGAGVRVRVNGEPVERLTNDALGRALLGRRWTE